MSEYIFREVHYGYTDGTALGCKLEKQEQIVRCMDCTWFANDAMHGAWCKNLGVSLHDDYDGFCALGERREA